MKELSEACRKAGIGFGFYYSHNQDWTFPGGSGGPNKTPDGKPASHNDQRFPIGWIRFPKPGRYTISVSCEDGDRKQASLKSMQINRVRM